MRSCWQKGGLSSLLQRCEHLVGGAGQAAGLVDEGEDREGGRVGRALQAVQAVLVVDELHVGPVDALSRVLLLRDTSPQAPALKTHSGPSPELTAVVFLLSRNIMCQKGEACYRRQTTTLGQSGVIILVS